MIALRIGNIARDQKPSSNIIYQFASGNGCETHLVSDCYGSFEIARLVLTVIYQNVESEDANAVNRTYSGS